MQLSPRVVRARVSFGDLTSPLGLTDVLTGDPIGTFRGNATTFQFTVFDSAGQVQDLSELETVTLRLQMGRASNAVVLLNRTLPAASFDLTTDSTTWSNGTKQQLEFEVAGQLLNFSVGDRVRDLWLVLVGITTDGNKVTLATSEFNYVDDSWEEGATSLPFPRGVGMTLEQADARYLRQQAGLASWLSTLDQQVTVVESGTTLISAVDDGKIFYFESLATLELCDPYANLGLRIGVRVVGTEVSVVGDLFDNSTSEWISSIDQTLGLVILEATPYGWRMFYEGVRKLAVLNTLGIPEYVDLSQANAALPVGKPFFNQTLQKLDITTA